MKILKRMIMGSFLIYTFNIIAIKFNIVLPINLWTVSFTSIFDVVGLVILILIKTIGV